MNILQYIVLDFQNIFLKDILNTFSRIIVKDPVF